MESDKDRRDRSQRRPYLQKFKDYKEKEAIGLSN